MNFKHEKNEWDGHEYIRVSKKQFENFIRYFRSKIEGNGFMGWLDYYDWSLNPNFNEETANEEESWDNLSKCMVARKYYEAPFPEYWLRIDYINANNYDLNTIVPKIRKKRTSKKKKQFVDFLSDAVDYVLKGMVKNNE